MSGAWRQAYQSKNGLMCSSGKSSSEVYSFRVGWFFDFRIGVPNLTESETLEGAQNSDVVTAGAALVAVPSPPCLRERASHEIQQSRLGKGAAASPLTHSFPLKRRAALSRTGRGHEMRALRSL